MKLKLASVLFVVWLSVFAQAEPAFQPALIRIAGSGLQVGLDPANGSLRELIQLADGTKQLDGGVNQLADNPALLGLWQITVREGEAVRKFAAEHAGPPQGGAAGG